jgi:predicted house-cleaning noncanonical NTP pyrophosphatase (MazG superfamily)
LPTYNKLVRDKIPEIIRLQGKNCYTKQLSKDEYIKELKIKLNEEVTEYEEANSNKKAIEELADILELLHSLATVHGYTFKHLERIRDKKATKRGGFKDKIYLMDVEE